MRTLCLFAGAILGWLLLTAAPARPEHQVPVLTQKEEPKQQRENYLGLGLGFALTPDEVGKVFGEGTDALIYVDHRLYKVFGLKASFGAISLGASEPDAELETYLAALDLFKGSFRNISMGFTYLTIGPSVRFGFGENHTLMAAVAYVFYDIKIELASLNAHRLTPKNKRNGLNISAGYAYWIGDSWGLNARFEWHRISTGTDWDDLYHAFARGDTDPRFFSFLIGLQIGYL